jgi:hypothetical protein
VQAPLLALERGQVDLVCQSLTALAAEHETHTPTGADTARKATAFFAERAAQVA